MTIELAGQAATIAAVIGFGVWNDRLFRKIGERSDLIEARLAALSAHPNGGDPHSGVAQHTNFEGRPN